MPRIKIGQPKIARTWKQTIAERIRAGKVVPIVSNVVGNNLVLGGHDKLVADYARYTGYPLDDRSLPHIAQFTSVIDESVGDPRGVKEDYINFVKNKLFDLAEQNGVPRDTLDELEDVFDDVVFSEFAERLGYPRYENDPTNPLLILAEFPLPIYLTTCYHDFLETALRRAGKRPHTDICRWHEGLKGIPSVFDDGYQPSRNEPLVYHLHGLDTYPGSLVLTEDDYMEFLVAISQNLGRDTDPIPRRVRQAMADSSLLLLGYNLQSWDFRSLFWGLIKPRPLQQTSVFVQLMPGEAEKLFLQKYLNEFEFKVYWGDVSQYVQELRQLVSE
ncbi:MAG: SIR2 family protein [Chloroflexi bacterium]|nr:MAG: SIR2 family protein [Chloroflexota bacterium]